MSNNIQKTKPYIIAEKAWGSLVVFKSKEPEEYTYSEEIFHSISHGLGALLSIAGLVVLVIFAANYGDAWHVISFSIFGTSLIILYLASTLYHSITAPRAKKIFKVLDHSAIYLLIAGSYTPFSLTNLRGVWGWSLFGIVWGLAIIGVVLKCVDISRFNKTSNVIYLLMGWLSVFIFKEIIEQVQVISLSFLILGGITYTLGFVFYAWEKLPYNHAIWHIFVLGGSLFHYFSILYIL